MKLEQSFEVSAPLERVWDALVDVERIAPCLPGAKLAGRNDDGSYDGTFKVKVGSTSVAYSGTVSLDGADAGAHTATILASGTDKRGQGAASATVVSRLVSVDGSTTRVEVVTDYEIQGRLSRLQRGGVIEEVSERLLSEFATSLQGVLATDATGSSEEEAGAKKPRARKPTAKKSASTKADAKPKDGAAKPARTRTRKAKPEEVEAAADAVAAAALVAAEAEAAAAATADMAIAAAMALAADAGGATEPVEAASTPGEAEAAGTLADAEAETAPTPAEADADAEADAAPTPAEADAAYEHWLASPGPAKARRNPLLKLGVLLAMLFVLRSLRRRRRG